MKFLKGKDFKNRITLKPYGVQVSRYKIMRTKIEKLENALTEVCNKYKGISIKREDIISESIIITRNTNLFSSTLTEELMKAANLLHADWYFSINGNQLIFRAYY